MKKVIIALLIAMFTLSANAETPNEASKAILELIKKKDYESIVRKRYSEIHKAKTEEEVKRVIDMLSKRWGKDNQIVISIFEQLSTAKFTTSKNNNPQKTETGRIATASFKLGDKTIPYKLYEMKNGLWGFHM